MRRGGQLGKFSTDDKVEVLSSEEGFSDAWAAATVIAPTKAHGAVVTNSLVVEYNKFVDETGSAMREKVPIHRLRHVPLFPTSFNVNVGLRVEGYLHDCWWPGEIAEQHPRKGLRIQFDDGDTAWLLRTKVRPMLRRAPRSADEVEADPEGAKFGARAAPPPRMPLRLPHGLHPNDAVEAIDRILDASGWESLRLSEVQARLEASLLPDEPAGWLAPWRHALLGAIERVLLNRLKPEARGNRGKRSPAAGGREAKRARGNGVGAKKEMSLFSQRLMRSNPEAVVPTMAEYLRPYGARCLSSPEVAQYLLYCMGPQVMQMLHHEQLTLYNYAPPAPPGQKRPSSAATDDGTVGCTVSDGAAGWRHECALCSTCIFNVHLLAHCPDRYELCVDCWSGAMRSAARWWET